MRARLIAALLAMPLLAGGCTTRQKIAGGGAALTVVGLGLTFSTEVKSEEESGTKGKVGITLLLTGLVTLFVAAALDEMDNKEKPQEIRVSRGPTEVERQDESAAIRAQRKRDEAWALTKQAQEAARAGDCPRVTALSAQVGALDAEFYASVFMKDLAVQRCFTPTETPPAPSPGPLPTP